MKHFSFEEFKPTIYFIAKFVGLYLVMNLLYGWFVSSYDPKPDPITSVVTNQAAHAVALSGHKVSAVDYQGIPTTGLVYKGRTTIGVYEGCNGVNTMIIFVAFVLSFGSANRHWAWFLPLGIFAIHVANLIRITLLFLVATYRPQAMYFTHKYLFTASLYAAVFVLWVIWVRKFASFRSHEQS